jgi:hypothetical protein
MRCKELAALCECGGCDWTTSISENETPGQAIKCCAIGITASPVLINELSRISSTESRIGPMMLFLERATM